MQVMCCMLITVSSPLPASFCRAVYKRVSHVIACSCLLLDFPSKAVSWYINALVTRNRPKNQTAWTKDRLCHTRCKQMQTSKRNSWCTTVFLSYELPFICMFTKLNFDLKLKATIKNKFFKFIIMKATAVNWSTFKVVTNNDFSSVSGEHIFALTRQQAAGE